VQKGLGGLAGGLAVDLVVVVHLPCAMLIGSMGAGLTGDGLAANAVTGNELSSMPVANVLVARWTILAHGRGTRSPTRRRARFSPQPRGAVRRPNDSWVYQDSGMMPPASHTIAATRAAIAAGAAAVSFRISTAL
jgi:hypothetical protein